MFYKIWNSIYKFFLFILIISLVAIKSASALVEIKINQGNINPLIIVIENFLGQTNKEIGLSKNIVAIINNNLQNSGLFKILDKKNFLKVDMFRVKILVKGIVTVQKNNDVNVKIKLLNIQDQKQIFKFECSGTQKNWRILSHKISNIIYEKLIGKKSYFNTQIIYISESISKNKRIKRLAIIDQDGFNRKFLTGGKSIVLSPSFNSKSQEITYVSYISGKPKVMLINIETNQSRLVSNFSGMSFSSSFSPDGNKIIMSFQNGINTNIYMMNLKNNILIKLTDSESLNVSASYSPNNKYIIFESNREGSQQLYIMDSNGNNVRRISKGSGEYFTPSWSPNGELIAFTKVINNQFLIGIMNNDGSNECILVAGYHNEKPSWSLNGKALLFFRETQGVNGESFIWSIDITGLNERKINTNGFASDPVWATVVAN